MPHFSPQTARPFKALKAGTAYSAYSSSLEQMTTTSAFAAIAASTREILLGTNQFPNFNEKAGDKKPVEGKCCCGGDSHTCEKDVDTLV